MHTLAELQNCASHLTSPHRSPWPCANVAQASSTTTPFVSTAVWCNASHRNSSHTATCSADRAIMSCHPSHHHPCRKLHEYMGIGYALVVPAANMDAGGIPRCHVHTAGQEVGKLDACRVCEVRAPAERGGAGNGLASLPPGYAVFLVGAMLGRACVQVRHLVCQAMRHRNPGTTGEPDSWGEGKRRSAAGFGMLLRVAAVHSNSPSR